MGPKKDKGKKGKVEEVVAEESGEFMFTVASIYS